MNVVLKDDVDYESVLNELIPDKKIDLKQFKTTDQLIRSIIEDGEDKAIPNSMISGLIKKRLIVCLTGSPDWGNQSSDSFEEKISLDVIADDFDYLNSKSGLEFPVTILTNAAF